MGPFDHIYQGGKSGYGVTVTTRVACQFIVMNFKGDQVKTYTNPADTVSVDVDRDCEFGPADVLNVIASDLVAVHVEAAR